MALFFLFLAILIILFHIFMGESLAEWWERVNSKPLPPDMPPVDVFGTRHAEYLAKKADLVGRQIISGLLPIHFEALMRKRRMLVYAGDYGEVNDSAWLKELGHFYEKLILPKLRLEFTKNGEWEEFLEVTNSSDVKSAFVEALNNCLGAAGEPCVHKEDELASENGLEYEVFRCERLRASGWSAERTASTGDQGADIVAKMDNLKVVVQCKWYNSKVGNKAVQEVMAAKIYYQADIAVVVSNQVFTPSAKRLAATGCVLLVHHDELSSLFNNACLRSGKWEGKERA